MAVPPDSRLPDPATSRSSTEGGERRKFLEPDPRTGLRLTDVQRNSIIAVILLVALVGIVVAVMMAATGNDQSSAALPDSVDRLIPSSGAEVLQQATVGIDVGAGYDAYLEINGTTIKIAADGLIKDLGTGLIQFTPGPGKPIESLQPEKNCVLAFVWKQQDGEATASPVSWCFTAA